MNAEASDTAATVRRLPVSQPRQPDVDSGSLTRVLWRGKLVIITSTLLCGAAAFGVSELFPRQYKATVLISPVVRDSRQAILGGRLGNLAGLAELAGIADTASGSRAEAIATLQSEVLTEKYIRDNNLLPVLYAKIWDADKKLWLETDPKKIPTPWKANRYFAKTIRTVTENRRTNLVTMNITWTDPVVAAKWANDLVQLTNDYLRQIAIEQSETNLEYLAEQAAKTTDFGMKNTIYGLMEVELRNAMMAKGDHHFALKVLDPAVPPERAFFPIHSLWALGGMLAGLFMSIFNVTKRNRKVAPPERPKHIPAEAKTLPPEARTITAGRTTTAPMWHLDVKL